MRIVLVISGGLMACGAYVLWRYPDIAAVGLLLIAIPGVVIVQAALLALVTIGQAPAADPTDPPAASEDDSELDSAVDDYRGFKVFLARLLGFFAIAYGIVNGNAYYFTLGLVAVVLFWIWDRMLRARMRVS